MISRGVLYAKLYAILGDVIYLWKLAVQGSMVVVPNEKTESERPAVVLTWIEQSNYRL